MDKFRVEVITQTPNPQQVIYAALHQDYNENFVFADKANWPSEEKCGEIAVKRLLAGDRGHYGSLEHPSIVFNCGFFPHGVMQQARTHRVGISFDVQCLAGNTEVTFVKKSGDLRKITIAELYDLWTYGEKAIRKRRIKGRNGEMPGEYRRNCQKRMKAMNLRVLNEDTEYFETSHLQDVVCSGLQPVYRLTFEDGKTLDCTTNHRLLTTDGWQTMGEAVGLKIGLDGNVIGINRLCKIMANGFTVAGQGLYRDETWLLQQTQLGLSTKEIANLAECSETCIKDWAKRFGIKLNKRNTQFQKGQKPWNYNSSALYRNKKWLEEQLEKGLYVDQIAELAECSIEAIKKWVYHYGLSLNKRPTSFQKGFIPWNKNKPGYRLNLSPESIEQRKKNSFHYAKRGEESNFWRGGTSTTRELIGAWTRQIAPQVHAKFNYICQKCGQRGKELHAHHLVPVFTDESLAYNFDNLITLCKECHENIHSHHLEAEFADNFQPITEPINWQNKSKPQGRRLKAHPLRVMNVTYLGIQMTYDLEVAEPWHNFVANGLVVHNSMRYTGQRVIDVAEGRRDVEEVFYLRPVDYYGDRQGKKYFYSPEQREKDLAWCVEAAKRYAEDIQAGMSEEHARGKLPFDYRQHFVVSFNCRSLMHFLDLRFKKDAQIEIQKLCELIWPHFQAWVPQIAEWYEKSRLGKAKLSP